MQCCSSVKQQCNRDIFCVPAGRETRSSQQGADRVAWPVVGYTTFWTGHPLDPLQPPAPYGKNMATLKRILCTFVSCTKPSPLSLMTSRAGLGPLLNLFPLISTRCLSIPSYSSGKIFYLISPSISLSVLLPSFTNPWLPFYPNSPSIKCLSHYMSCPCPLFYLKCAQDVFYFSVLPNPWCFRFSAFLRLQVSELVECTDYIPFS